MLSKLNTIPLNFHQSIDNIDDYDAIITIIDHEENLSDQPYAEALLHRYRRMKEVIAAHQEGKNKKSKHEAWSTVLPNKLGSKQIIVNNIKGKDVVKWLKKLSNCLSDIKIKDCQKIALNLVNSDDKTAQEALRVLLAHLQNMPNYSQNHKPVQVEIDVIGDYYESDFIDVLAKHTGNALARYLTILPSNYLTPEIYIEALEQLAHEQGWAYDYFDKKDLQEMGAGAFSAVARASDMAGIVKLSYKAANACKLITLVGKGVCFDTGGVSLKQPQYMEGMNDDMMGSAVALGSFAALSMLQVPYDINCYLAITRNNIGEHAFVPNEVVTALNGKTIEVIDTDAEGRMILADTLVLASREKPDILIDFATLTGAAVRALGTQYSAIFSNHYDWYAKLIECGIESGEKVWPFPMDNSFMEGLKSDIADLKQCAVIGNADHILAAKFLQQFVDKNIRWLHVDLASCKNKNGLGAIPTEVTGVGVWFAIEALNGLPDQKEN